MVKILLKHKAQIDFKCFNGKTALCAASENDHMRIAEMLIACGANINFANSDGGTPLIFASENGHVAIATLMQLWMMV